MEIGSIKSDETKELDGIWFPYRDCSEILVASISNPKFQKFYEALKRPLRRQRELGAVDPVAENALLCKAMARHVLLGWRGFTKKRAELKYSEETAYELLKDSRVFRNDVASLASADDAFTQDLDEDTEKNSETRSNGPSGSDQSATNSSRKEPAKQE